MKQQTKNEEKEKLVLGFPPRLCFLLFLFAFSFSFSVYGDIYINLTEGINHVWDFPDNFSINYLAYEKDSWDIISKDNISYLSNVFNPEIPYIKQIGIYQSVNGWVPGRNSQVYGNISNKGIYINNTEETPALIIDILFNDSVFVLNSSKVIINLSTTSTEGGATPYYLIGFALNDTELTSTRNTSGYLFNEDGILNMIFNRMIIGKWTNGVGTNLGFHHLINGITIKDGYFSTNELPYFNLSYNVTCFNESKGYSDIPININAYDEEGDTILYSDLKNNGYSLDRIITFDKYDNVGYSEWSYILFCKILDPSGYWGLCTEFDKYGVALYQPTEDIDTLCEVMDDINYPSQLNRSVFYTFDEAQFYKLGWNISKCQQDEFNKKLSIYNSYYEYTDNIYALSFMLEVLNDTYLTYNPSYDNFFTSVNPVIINRTNGVTRLRFGSDTFNTTKSKIEFKYLIDYDSNVYKFSIYEFTSVYFTTPVYSKTYTITTDNRPYLSFNGVKGTIFLDDIVFYRENSTFNYSTTEPDSIRVYKPGTYDYYVYVRDVYHNFTDYNSDFISIYVPECSYFVSPLEYSEEMEDLSEGFDLFKFFNILLGKPFRDYMDEIDTNNILESVLWWAYLILFVGFFISNYLATKTPDIILSMIGSSGVMFFLGIISGVTSILIVSLIGIAFGFAIPLSSGVGGNSGR